MIVIYLPQVISGKGHLLMAQQSLLRKDTNMKKLFSMLLIVLILVTSLSVTASAATRAGWAYEALELYQTGTTVRTNPHSALRGQVQMGNYATSKNTVYVAVEMVTGGSYVKYSTVSIPVGVNSGTSIVDSPTGSAVNTRGVVWTSSTGARASGDLGYYK